ncbi:hypothetical protein [Cohnella sp. GCM10012308]|uniref:hypothetical protein n=1 Tax=Cohnella sp. GCM10012308 TaxID=3317329 RepID=UPI00361BEF74
MLEKLNGFTFNHSDQADRLSDSLTADEVKEKFDSRGEELRLAVNALIDALQAVTSGDSGALNIGASTIADLNGTTVQAILQSIRDILKGSSGAGFVGASAIAGLSGGTVQALLQALKDLIDSQGTSVGQNYVTKSELTNVRKLSEAGNFTGSWFGISNPALADPGIGGVVLQHSGQMPIDPESFSGNSRQKLQSALDYAITNKGFVQLRKMYDITGQGSIKINKAADYGDRRVLYIIGNGGGIIKNDGGIIFTADNVDVGDINISNCRFESTANMGCKIWDCDKIIRLQSSNNEYYNVDTIAYAATRYFQSVRFDSEHIVGGKSWAFYAFKTIDTTIKDCLIENREHGIGNLTNTSGDPNFQQNHNLRILNNVIEGLTGYAIQLGNCWACTIARNYLESNTLGYLDLKTLVTASHFGLVVENNVFYLTTAQKSGGFKPAKVGNLFVLTTSSVKIDCNAFIGNVSDGELYEKTGTGTINSFGDYAFQQTGFASGVNVLTGYTKTGPNNVRTSGVIKAFSFTYSDSLLANETKTVAIVLTDATINGPINNKDAINVYINQISSVSVLGVSPIWQSASTGTLYVTLQNRTAAAVNPVGLVITVTKAYD